MPIILSQGNIACSNIVCRSISFVGDNSELSGIKLFKPTRIVLPQTNDPIAPTFAFGDGDSGFYETADDEIRVSILGSQRFRWSGDNFDGLIADGVRIRNVAATATIPTLCPSRADNDTGIGHRTTDIGVLIAGAQNCMEFGEAGAAPLIGFYGTAAIALQTGVAVSAAGVHAALVALGLITA